MAKSNPKCIVCGRAIKQDRRMVWLRSEEQAARGVGSSDWITASKLPRTVEECRRFTNQPIIGKTYSYSDTGEIHAFTTWDGESYEDDYFCRQACARKQGYASAFHGHRYVWKS